MPKKLHSPGSPTNMDWKRKIAPDHTDQAYREAVSRLRTMLSPRPQSRSSILGSPSKTIDKSAISGLDSNYSPEVAKKGMSNSIRSMLLKDSNTAPSVLNNNTANMYPSVGYKPAPSVPITSDYLTDREDDLFGFIEKQGEYITQLEKETKYCRDELSTMLEKVREVISENEALHEQQKKDILTSMIKQLDEKTPTLETPRQTSATGKKSNLSGSSNVILESRVAEMEAQLSQARRSLRLAQEEILDLRKGKLKELTEGGGNPSDSSGILASNPYAHCELHRDEIDRISREKNDLVDTLTKLKSMTNELKDRESDAAKKVKSSLEIIEHMRVEKDQSDMETGRLKEELDRYQKRVREMIQDHTRKLHEEKLQVERKYRQELDHLSSEMTQELDALTRSRIDLERQKRLETDLRRELEQKQAAVEDIRQEMQIKIGHLQKELSHALSQKSSVEQDLINSRLNAEKMERDGKQEAMRLQAEINALRKRLEQSDIELVKSQEMVAKLSGSLSQHNRDEYLAKLRLEEHVSGDPQDKNVVGLIQDMEEKHSRDMTELEQLIQVQNNLLDKLRGECKVLTEKLEDTHRNYKKERAVLDNERSKLAQASEVAHKKCSELEQRVQFYQTSHDQMTDRLHTLEQDDKARSDRQ
ncbi:Serologically defined colon cancer antigen 8 [Orchesella cincta]|uniref:Serologically defined colon cancer antigen 8 n=1 Tax=Orchesella cincta TaxID=48709 RepID=A0A1D2N2K2_ORCCI|nr:Serologically defined colon cancer antigen 8 [Orchesella cincta]